ncbi:unnamed protein product [Caenorhabditis auriculariae]|uniref:6-phosphogluconolactonase n=1 Tax=Caenorhabditis auriculariae TaxID=2777116 RepID=A0A8S1HMU9_9PELO|nr:unnamed protein product [Caenorhabditis auriculariae]
MVFHKPPSVIISKDQDELKENVQKFLTARIQHLLEYHGNINIGVSGGSMPKLLCEVWKEMGTIIPWKKMRIFMVDERIVPITHPDSNYGQYIAELPEELHKYVIPAPIQEQDSLHQAAHNYETTLRKEIAPEQMGSTARFDILLLGVGPDGHTCSIFPSTGTERRRLPKLTDFNWVSAVSDSPKPPPKRITLTMPVLNAAKNVAFIITGKEKAHVVKSMYTAATSNTLPLASQSIPAAQVRPMNNNLWYFIDDAAASELKSIPPVPEDAIPPADDEEEEEEEEGDDEEDEE